MEPNSQTAVPSSRVPAVRPAFGYGAVFRMAWERGIGRRTFLLLPALALFGVWLCLTRLCLWLDTILFPAFRRVDVREPLFIVGVPRSGTTFLHRLVAGDTDRFTTFALWEIILAPSIVQRRVAGTLAAWDRAIGGPLSAILNGVERRVLGSLDDVHHTSLRDPEEDYLALLPLGACFLLVLLFPGDERVWRLARFDSDFPESDRRRVMAYYRELVQRHVYVHGPEKQFLSKNPSFTPMVRSLSETFPDARFVTCYRSPLAVVPSLFNSMEDGLRVFGNGGHAEGLHRGLSTMLRDHYGLIARYREEYGPERIAPSAMEDLAPYPREAVERIYTQFGWELPPAFAEFLADEAERARTYRSGHRYSLAQFGMTEEALREQFAEAFSAFGYGAKPGEAA